MRIDRAFLWWGLFFIALGAVPLAVDLGWVSADAVHDLWRLWPLILVGIGVGLLLRRSQLALIGTVLTSLTFGLALGGVAAGTGVGGMPIFFGCGSGTEAGGPTSGSLSGSATVNVDWACGGLTVRDQGGTAWQLTTSGSATETAVTASESSLAVNSAGSFRITALGDRGLTLVVPTDPTLDLHVNQGFGDGTVTLSGAHLAGLQAKIGFGAGNVSAGGATLNGTLDLRFEFGSGHVFLPLGAYHGTISSSFGSLNVCVPASLGVRVEASSSFGSADFGPDFVQVGGAWQTSDYTSATNRADLTISSSFGSLNMSRCS
jgi:hypothetical protein